MAISKEQSISHSPAASAAMLAPYQHSRWNLSDGPQAPPAPLGTATLGPGCCLSLPWGPQALLSCRHLLSWWLLLCLGRARHLPPPSLLLLKLSDQQWLWACWSPCPSHNITGLVIRQPEQLPGALRCSLESAGVTILWGNHWSVRNEMGGSWADGFPFLLPLTACSKISAGLACPEKHLP